MKVGTEAEGGHERAAYMIQLQVDMTTFNIKHFVFPRPMRVVFTEEVIIHIFPLCAVDIMQAASQESLVC